MRHGYDTCDGDGCGVTSNLFPFPHTAACRYGTGQHPICTTCQHPADQHEPTPDGPRCHGCFMAATPSHHLYEMRSSQ